MASKYYNPTLATRVAQAGSKNFVDVSKSFGEGFEKARKVIEPIIKPMMDKYQKDLEAIAAITIDQSGIPAHLRQQAVDFARDVREETYKAREMGVLTGAEKVQESKNKIQGASTVLKEFGNIINNAQSAIPMGSSANGEEEMNAMRAVVESGVDLNDPDGNFFTLPTGQKTDFKGLSGVLSNFLITPEESYLNIDEYARNAIKKKFHPDGSVYYGYDDVDADNFRRRVAEETNDLETGTSFTFDALSNPDPYRGLNPEFTKYKTEEGEEIQFNFLGKSRKQIMDAISSKVPGINNPQEAEALAKEIVVNGYHKGWAQSFGKEKRYRDPLDDAKIKEIKARTKSVKAGDAKTGLIEKELREAASIINTTDIESILVEGPMPKNLDPRYENDLKTLGLSYLPIMQKDEEGNETGVVEGYTIFNSRIGKGKTNFQEDILAGDDPSLIRKKIFDALGRKYETIDLTYDELFEIGNKPIPYSRVTRDPGKSSGLPSLNN
jgi:hypothetical protein